MSASTIAALRERAARARLQVEAEEDQGRASLVPSDAEVEAESAEMAIRDAMGLE